MQIPSLNYYLIEPAGGDDLWFASVKGNEEDFGNTDYLRDTALQSGWNARAVWIEDLGWDSASRQFVDLDDTPVGHIFKLYPWEWMLREAFAPHLLHQTALDRAALNAC